MTTLAPTRAATYAAQEPAPRMRAYVLRLVAAAYDTCADRGAIPDELGACLNAQDFATALAQLIQTSVPSDAGHPKDSCLCLACSFYEAYDWDLLEPLLVVAGPS